MRLGTLGIAYNTRLVKEPPKTWADLAKPAFKGAYGIANPALSGTAYMSVAVLSKAFGWKYFEGLRANGAKMGKGSGQVVDDTASGDLVASLAVDYITLDKIDKGATLALVYPPEMLVIPSPIAIFKGSPNVEAAKKFVDFVLSKEGQTIIANEGTLPVRADVKVPERFKLPPVDDAVKRAMKVDYQADHGREGSDHQEVHRHHAEVSVRRSPARLQGPAGATSWLTSASAGSTSATARRPCCRGSTSTLVDGECFTLLGPSGCGKTVLLRLIAGFETPDAGTIRIGGQRVADAAAGAASCRRTSAASASCSRTTPSGRT